MTQALYAHMNNKRKMKKKIDPTITQNNYVQHSKNQSKTTRELPL
jgi:hypothetical protein